MSTSEEELVKKALEENPQEEQETVKPQLPRWYRRKVARAVHHNAFTKKYANPKSRTKAYADLDLEGGRSLNDIFNGKN